VVTALTASFLVPSPNETAASSVEAVAFAAAPSSGVTSIRTEQYLRGRSDALVHPLPVTSAVMSVPVA